jgi:hypothetical protein
MGYAEKSGKVFSSRFCRRETAIETVSPQFGMRKGRIAHAANLTLFLIFCKLMPPGGSVQHKRKLSLLTLTICEDAWRHVDHT